uniref:Vp39 n=1 Tax=Cnaphalocrocis medinalis granulovirus TaxID=1750712 RepID=A0A125QVW4_9BBAC|nr:vp39 [Cnaphalocrocis medinalis granulovirus]
MMADYDNLMYNICDLNNFCIFQDVSSDLCTTYNNNNYYNRCSPDAANCFADRTFICNYHLGKYFKILKSSLLYPRARTTDRSRCSWDNRYCHKTVLADKRPEYLFLLITKLTLNTSARNLMERFVIYTIYEDKDKIKELCETLLRQEFYEQNLWIAFQNKLGAIMNMVNPTNMCEKPIQEAETRIFNDNTYALEFPIFLKNLINRLVKPTMLSIQRFVIKIEDKDTCSFTKDGLIVPDLHNPNQPVRLEVGPMFQPQFNIRTYVEFSGRATMEQRALNEYEEVILSRPLLNGSQTNV